MITVENLCKDFILPDKISIFPLLRGRHLPVFRALDGLSFTLAEGDIMGVIGHNGAGKSTLLKILGGITQPTSGSVTVQGRISLVLELSTGFNPVFSGRQNIVQRLFE